MQLIMENICMSMYLNKLMVHNLYLCTIVSAVLIVLMAIICAQWLNGIQISYRGGLNFSVTCPDGSSTFKT